MCPIHYNSHFSLSGGKIQMKSILDLFCKHKYIQSIIQSHTFGHQHWFVGLRGHCGGVSCGLSIDFNAVNTFWLLAWRLLSGPTLCLLSRCGFDWTASLSVGSRQEETRTQPNSTALAAGNTVLKQQPADQTWLVNSTLLKVQSAVQTMTKQVPRHCFGKWLRDGLEKCYHSQIHRWSYRCKDRIKMTVWSTFCYTVCLQLHCL
jgi:hypothetical protein